MSARTLTNEEYAKLARKALEAAGVDTSTYGHAQVADAVNHCKWVHRLLTDGREAEDLAITEQIFAPAFKGMKLVQIPNDYGWEPGVEVEAKAEPPAEPKPKKKEK